MHLVTLGVTPTPTRRSIIVYINIYTDIVELKKVSTCFFRNLTTFCYILTGYNFPSCVLSSCNIAIKHMCSIKEITKMLSLYIVKSSFLGGFIYRDWNNIALICGQNIINILKYGNRYPPNFQTQMTIYLYSHALFWITINE